MKIDPGAYALAEDVLSCAQRDFDTYILDKMSPYHFMNVSISGYPQRRIDATFTDDRQFDLEERYKRNHSMHRWQTQDCRTLVEESEIFDTIISCLRGSERRSYKAMYKAIVTRVAGIHREDVKYAMDLWKQYGLDLFTQYDDSFWHGVPATECE